VLDDWLETAFGSTDSRHSRDAVTASRAIDQNETSSAFHLVRASYEWRVIRPERVSLITNREIAGSLLVRRGFRNIKPEDP
jgi:hypothetical protein